MLMDNSSINQVVNVLKSLEIPAITAVINSVKCIVSLESKAVADIAIARGECSIITLENDLYLVCRPF